MYEVSVEAVFNASHQLPTPAGDWEPVHGHEWLVTATFTGCELDQAGVLLDFVAAERRLRETVALLHNTNLNECPVLEGSSPSAERVAKVIYDLMVQEEPFRSLLRRVRVCEAPGCTAGYVAPQGN